MATQKAKQITVDNTDLKNELESLDTTLDQTKDSITDLETKDEVEDTEPEVTPRDPDAVGINIKDDTETNTSTAEYISSVVGGFRYYFPVEHPRSFSEALLLGSSFIEENLFDGQIFSLNPQRMTPFLFIPECNIVLNPANSTWIYREGQVDPSAIRVLISHVRTGDLVLGDHGITKLKPKVQEPKVNMEEVLSKQLRDVHAYLMKLLSSRVEVDQFGNVHSPGVEIKALIAYEEKTRRRPDVLKLLNKAMHQVGGMVEYADTQEVDAAIQAKMKVDERVRGFDRGNSATISTANAVNPTSLL